MLEMKQIANHHILGVGFAHVPGDTLLKRKGLIASDIQRHANFTPSVAFADYQGLHPGKPPLPNRNPSGCCPVFGLEMWSGGWICFRF
jgi:hypothetical protein